MDRRPRRIRELARHARDRRFRLADLRGTRVPGRQAARAAARHERVRRLEGAAVKRAHKPGLLLVAAREWRWLMRDRAAPLLVFGVPLLAFAILLAVFTHPVIRQLRTVVVDEDRTQTSRNLIEIFAASPNLRIAQRAEDLSAAARALRSGDAIAAVYIPANFERDLRAQRRPQVVAFYNQEQLTAAGIASQGLRDALSAAASRVSPASTSAPAAPRIGTLSVQSIVLVNPERNYVQFLLRALLPAVL